uniref:Uncharacterized protein n=1 Tax=viral metagenome TaxID=1070528 RepID=A0A6M3KPL1_9ZZZZ
MATIAKSSIRGNAAMSITTDAIATGRYFQLVSVGLAFSVAPTSSESFTVTLNAAAGEDHDMLLYSVDPAASVATDILYQPDAPIYLAAGDYLDIAYANTDNRTWAVQVVWREVY